MSQPRAVIYEVRLRKNGTNMFDNYIQPDIYFRLQISLIYVGTWMSDIGSLSMVQWHSQLTFLLTFSDLCFCHSYQISSWELWLVARNSHTYIHMFRASLVAKVRAMQITKCDRLVVFKKSRVREVFISSLAGGYFPSLLHELFLQQAGGHT